MLPTELVDNIFEYLPVKYSITYGRTYVKKLLLKTTEQNWYTDDLEKIKWLIEHDAKGYCPDIMYAAAEDGLTDIVKELFFSNKQVPEEIADGAVFGNSLELVTFVYSHGFKCQDDVLEVTTPSKEILEFLYSQGYQWPDEALETAIDFASETDDLENWESVEYLINTNVYVSYNSIIKLLECSQKKLAKLAIDHLDT